MMYYQGEKVVFKKSGKLYDFGYYTKTGAVIYYEGERNMQDSIAVNLIDIVRATAYKSPTTSTVIPYDEDE